MLGICGFFLSPAGCGSMLYSAICKVAKPQRSVRADGSRLPCHSSAEQGFASPSLPRQQRDLEVDKAGEVYTSACSTSCLPHWVEKTALSFWMISRGQNIFHSHCFSWWARMPSAVTIPLLRKVESVCGSKKLRWSTVSIRQSW